MQNRALKNIVECTFVRIVVWEVGLIISKSCLPVFRSKCQSPQPSPSVVEDSSEGSDSECLDVGESHDYITPGKKKTRDKEKARSYARLYRAKLPDEKRATNRQQSKLRMRKHREKLRHEGGNKQKLTSSQVRKQRAKWRKAKQRQRAILTPTKTMRKAQEALQRKIDKLSPEQFAQVLYRATPRKKKYLKTIGVYNSPQTKKSNTISRKLAFELTSSASILMQKRDMESRSKLHTLTQSAGTTNLLGLKWETFEKYRISSEEFVTRKKRSDALSGETETQVEEFYKDHSRELPLRRQAGKAVLSDTTQRLHTDWSHDASKPHLGLSKFQKMRPKNIYTVDKAAFVNCLCEYCLNVDYLVSCTLF